MLLVALVAATASAQGKGRGRDRDSDPNSGWGPAATPPVAPPLPHPAPSANKGRVGTYPAKTSIAGCNYYVYVPKSCSDANPAGLHIFFHGQGGQGGAPSFDQWAKDFLEPQNLIGINMQYLDGDNMKDTPGKVAAAIEAITQVMADYKVIEGRGVIASFSGGGLPHMLLAVMYGRAEAKKGTWFFNHSAAYDSNCVKSAKGLMPMSWFFGLGSEEFDLALLGRSQTSRAQELFEEAATLPGRCPDAYLKIIKGKGHSIAPEDVTASAQMFRRSDLAFAPFLYEPDYAGAALEAAVKKANLLDLGGAATDVKRLLANEKLMPDVRVSAEVVRIKIEKRVDAVLALATSLSQDDPLLWWYYGKLFAKQLTGHPRVAELKKLPPLTPEQQKDVEWALNAFARHLRDFFTAGAHLNAEGLPILQKIPARAGEKSSLGRMAAEFLLLQPPPPPPVPPTPAPDAK
jgi:hypothetical protein